MFKSFYFNEISYIIYCSLGGKETTTPTPSFLWFTDFTTPCPCVPTFCKIPICQTILVVWEDGVELFCVRTLLYRVTQMSLPLCLSLLPLLPFHLLLPKKTELLLQVSKRTEVWTNRRGSFFVFVPSLSQESQKTRLSVYLLIHHYEGMNTVS